LVSDLSMLLEIWQNNVKKESVSMIFHILYSKCEEYVCAVWLVIPIATTLNIVVVFKVYRSTMCTFSLIISNIHKTIEM
jgi:hypothetical protein